MQSEDIFWTSILRYVYVVFVVRLLQKKNRLVSALPMDHILLESDSPALGPDKNVWSSDIFDILNVIVIAFLYILLNSCILNQFYCCYGIAST